MFTVASNSIGTGRIENPKFLEGVDSEIALARLVVTILCDGNIQENKKGIDYYESNIERIVKIELGLQEFGYVPLNPIWNEKQRLYSSYLSNVFNIIVQYLGLEVDDKTIQNPELRTEFAEGFSWTALCAFIEDTIPEDGHFKPWRSSC
ncbi:MAG: hypothetical protein EAX81_02535 [Candidatus Thorarchaeota archaeon]|nr:hypothetical protein [Candidatus Thorarchaeota archaeon]